MTLDLAFVQWLFPSQSLGGVELSLHPEIPQLSISAHVQTPQVACPLCKTRSSSLHSHYTRTLSHTPCFGGSVQLLLRVRRFRCKETTCSRQVFCEPLEGIAGRSARMTLLLSQRIQDTALLAGGALGRDMGMRWGVTKSRNTYLRTLRRMTPPPVSHAVKRIGVDDFAFKKGTEYGTLIIDLDTGHPIEVLPDRSATTLATWLKQHPNIELATRDRSTEYARGLSEGAPQAKQVLDRWHLVKNLRDALERQLQRLRPELTSVLTSTTAPGTATAPLQPTGVEHAAQEALERRQARYAEIYRLHQQGKSLAAIRRECQANPATVRRAIRVQGQVERRRHARPPGILTPFEPLLLERFKAGCRNASGLYREIQAAGYHGSKRRVILWVQERRDVPAPTTPGPFRESALQNKTLLPSETRPAASLTMTQVSWLLFSRPDELEEDRQGIVEGLLTHPVLQSAHSLIHRFRTLVRNRAGEGVSQWLKDTLSSGLTDLVSFARGLEREGEPLNAALTLSFSNGPTEGGVNRLKTIKRQMYGRAKFDLLRIRVLYG